MSPDPRKPITFFHGSPIHAEDITNEDIDELLPRPGDPAYATAPLTITGKYGPVIVVSLHRGQRLERCVSISASIWETMSLEERRAWFAREFPDE